MARVALAIALCGFGAAEKWEFNFTKDFNDPLRLVVGGSLASNSPILDYYKGFPANGVKYITAAGTDPVGDATSIGNWFRQAGITAEWIPVYGSNCATRAFDQQYVNMVRVANAIYMSGGQSGNVQACLFGGQTTYRDTPLLNAMQEKEILGGSSAGAMNQPTRQILVTGSSVESYQAVRDGSIAFRARGNAFIRTDELVDVHFAERGRQGRLVVFAAQVQARWAFGVDENSAYVWRPSGIFEAIGRNGVAVYQNTQGTAAQQTATMHFLSLGDRIDLNTGVITFASWKTRCTRTTLPTASNSIFGGVTYRTTSIAMAQFTGTSGSLNNFHGSPAVRVTFSVTGNQQAFCGTQGGISYTSFRNLQVTQTRNTDFINTEVPPLPQDYMWPTDE